MEVRKQQGQDFDGTDDYIDLGDLHNDVDLFASAGNPWTVTSVFKASEQTGTIIARAGGTGGNRTFQSYFQSTSNRAPSIYLRGELNDFDWGYDDNQHHLLTVTWDGTDANMYGDGGTDSSALNVGAASEETTENIIIGARTGGTAVFFNGIQDEVRISSTARSAAWIAATYDSLWDTLLTYGSEETAGAGEATNVLFIFSLY